MTTLADPVEQIGATHVRCRGRRLLYFGGCDYFRLAHHPRVLAAARECLRNHGLNVAASRATTGNHPMYLELERELARFFGAPGALLVSSGYASNLVVAQALAGEFTHVLIDERAHAALATAAQLFGARVIRFSHASPPDVQRRSSRLSRSARIILLTDGMFAHNGSVAPLRAYLEALPARAWMLVDDAHGAGVIGKSGRGSLEREGVSRARIIQTITLSKAFGGYGGAILGGRQLIGQMTRRSPLFVGSTPAPLPSVAAALASLRELAAHPGHRTRLHRNAHFVREALRAAGMEMPDQPGPIVCIVPRTAAESAAFQRALLKHGILPPLSRYPGAPPGGWFRFVISSAHRPAQLRELIAALTSVA